MRILTLFFLFQITSISLFTQVELTFANLEAGDTKNVNSHEPIFQTPDGNFLRLRDYKTGETSAKDKIMMQKLDASGKLLASTPWQLTASGESFIAHCGIIKFKDKILMIIRRDKKKSSTFQILEIVDHNQIEERILIDDLPAYYSPLHGDFYGVRISPNQKYLLFISSCGGR